MSKSTKSDSEVLKDAAATLNDLPAEAMDAVRQLVKEVRDETLDLVQAGREQAEAMGDAAGDAIADHPYRSICIALGVGCLIGMVISRR